MDGVFTKFVAGLYDGMYLSDLNGYELRVIKRLENDGCVVIIEDRDFGDNQIRMKT